MSILYPFHFRGQGGLAGVGKFKNIVNADNANIEVRLKKSVPKKVAFTEQNN